MTPIEYYKQQCQSNLIQFDAEQYKALECLERIYQQLVKQASQRSGFFNFLSKPTVVTGLYLVGGVGIGKTFIMDCFYHCLPFQAKIRLHFHQFMHLIHQELKQLQGEKNPLKIIAKKISQQAMVLCFDEFYVSEIVDAMLLGNLLQELFKQGVCLVTTSNVLPDALYKRGLQRQLFLPAIQLIKDHTQVLALTSQVDYRLAHPKQANLFNTPLNADTEIAMEKMFAASAINTFTRDFIEINGRNIPVKKISKEVIWFDFNAICHPPRSQQDYLQLVKQYKKIMISNIPRILPQDKNTISLFIRMIDVFYDARIQLICSAADQVENLYSGGHMMFEYARTCSRLLEMQSVQYL